MNLGKSSQAISLQSKTPYTEYSEGLRKELEPKESLDLEDRLLNCLINKPIRLKVLKKSNVDWIKRKLAPKFYPGQKERAKKAAEF